MQPLIANLRIITLILFCSQYYDVHFIKFIFSFFKSSFHRFNKFFKYLKIESSVKCIIFSHFESYDFENERTIFDFFYFF